LTAAHDVAWPETAEPGTVPLEQIAAQHTASRSPSVPREQGTGTISSVPRSRTQGVGNGEQSLYTDVAALLDGTMPKPPKPTYLYRTDGCALFYPGQVSLVFGDPESGKTWICLACVAEVLSHGHSALVIDLDHNGPHSTIARLVMLGAPETALRDPERFRYAEPEDGMELLAIVHDASTWKPDVVVLDSVGEVVPLFGGSSNSPDDFTRVHSQVMKPLAMGGAAVLCIDHLAKGMESRAQGSTGTAAKRRAIGGISLRVTIRDAFVPGKGGAAYLVVNKDRHGGVRANCPTGDKEPLAGTFVMTSHGDDETEWQIVAPANNDRNPGEIADAADVAALAALDPRPASVRDVKERMKWRSERANAALKAWRELPVPACSPFPTPGVGEQGTGAEGTCSICHTGMFNLGDGATTHPGCEAA